MDIYLDSADTSQWALPAGCPPVVGVTTNPSLVFQAGLPVNLASYVRLVRGAGATGMGQLMVQLPSNDVEAAHGWVEKLQAVATQERVSLTIKLPCHPSWIDCIAAVQAMNQAILLTGLSNAVQLLWAQSLRADFVAPYVGRLAADSSQGLSTRSWATASKPTWVAFMGGAGRALSSARPEERLSARVPPGGP